MGEWWNGEEKIITEDPVRQSDSLLLEIFMKICPWKLLVFGSQSFPCDFLRNILRKIPQRGDNKMHFIKWFFFFGLAWNLSLTHLHCRLQLLFFQSRSHWRRLSHTVPSVSYKPFQTRPLCKDQPSRGQSTQSATSFHKGRLWEFRLEVHKSVYEEQHTQPTGKKFWRNPCALNTSQGKETGSLLKKTNVKHKCNLG